MTAGRGPDRCFDAVGAEAHVGGSLDSCLDRAKQLLRLQLDRAHVVREIIMLCRKGGTVSIPGVYVGFVDEYPLGQMMNRGLTVRTGQTHMQRYMRPLLKRIEGGEIDPSFVVTHRLPLEQGPAACKTFRDKQDGCIKVVLKP